MAVVEGRTYRERLTQLAPRQDVVGGLARAFAVGGGICAIGQGVQNLFLAQGMSPKEAAAPVAVVMVLLGSLATALGVYDKLGQVGGMGAALPITGFSNSMTAPALEFKREGWVLGLGGRMFSVAGPVLVFGFVTAWVMAMLAWVLGKLGVHWGMGG
jgi:stage V sporulation protein AC